MDSRVEDEREGGHPPCDLSTICGSCGSPTDAEHPHNRYPACGRPDSRSNRPYL